MYKSIVEMISDIEHQKDKNKQLELLKKYHSIPQFKLFLHYAFFNKLKPLIEEIPPYDPNMVDITFSYIKMEKGLKQLKYFFEGVDAIHPKKKREDRLLSILEEMSWSETPVYEMLVLNKFKNKVLTKKLIMDANLDMELSK